MNRHCSATDRAIEIRATSTFAHLRERQPEIEATILRRARSLSATADTDIAYLTGLREAVRAVLAYSLTWLEHGQEPAGQVPAAVVEQARRAARQGTPLETVVLRYIAGYRLFASVVREAARDHGVSAGGMQRSLGDSLDALLERLMTVVADEYGQELHRLAESAAHQQQQLVQRLLAGEPLDTRSLSYNLDDWHLGLIAVGPSAEQSVQEIASKLGRKLLCVPSDPQIVWAWLGGPRPLASCSICDEMVGESCRLSVGEPAEGLDGWRQTHEQAQTTLAVALRVEKAVTRSVDVPLEAALLGDELAAAALIDGYLKPLDDLRMGGTAARETLLAYFACERNASSTAHRLGVRSRHTITERLHKIGEGLGRPLQACLAELELALRLEILERTPPVVELRHAHKEQHAHHHPNGCCEGRESTTLVGPGPNLAP